MCSGCARVALGLRSCYARVVLGGYDWLVESESCSKVCGAEAMCVLGQFERIEIEDESRGFV